MDDYLVRIVSRENHIRGIACISTKLVRDAAMRHGAYPTAAVALGRALTGGALMGALLKDRQRVALKFEGNGPLRKILVEADDLGNVRGYVGDPQVDLPARNGKFDVAGALGRAGLLTVTKDLGLKEPYRGIVQLYTSEIASDLAYYFTESEQIPSAAGLGVFAEPEAGIVAAGGFLVQSLPPSDSGVIEALVTRLEQLPPVSELVRQGATPERILAAAFEGIPFDILEKRPVKFQCSCSRERFERALVSLGKTEIENLLAEQGELEAVCEFCHKRYALGRREVEAIRESI